MKTCKHNRKTQYTCGFYCNDCNRFISSDTVEYKLSEGITNLWMVLHNFICDNPDKKTEEIKIMEEKLFFPKKPTIELYNEALNLIRSLGLKETDARVTIRLSEVENE